MKSRTEQRTEQEVAQIMVDIVWKNFGRYRFGVDPRSDHHEALILAERRGWCRRVGRGLYELTDRGAERAARPGGRA